jgi:hypothetical protein
MTEQQHDLQPEPANEALDEELQDLDVGEDADMVTGGTNDPCEGGQFHER